LDNVNKEIEKLTYNYLKLFLKETKDENMDNFSFYSKMFLACVYNDTLIKEFLVFLYNTFRRNKFYGEHYPILNDKVLEIYNNFDLFINRVAQISSGEQTLGGNKAKAENEQNTVRRENSKGNQELNETLTMKSRKEEIHGKPGEPKTERKNATKSQAQKERQKIAQKGSCSELPSRNELGKSMKKRKKKKKAKENSAV
jgi:hypothetical protein